MNSLWDICIFLGLVLKESHCTNPTNATYQLHHFILMAWKSERGYIVPEWHTHIKKESLSLSLEGTLVCYIGFKGNMVFLHLVMASTRKPGLPALVGTFRLGVSTKKVEKKLYRFLQTIQPMQSWSAVYCIWFFMHPFLDRHLITLQCPSSMQLLPSLIIQHPQHRSAAGVFHSLHIPLDNKQHGVQWSYVCSSWLNTNSPIRTRENFFTVLVTFTCYMGKHQMLETLRSGRVWGKYSMVTPPSSLLLQF